MGHAFNIVKDNKGIVRVYDSQIGMEIKGAQVVPYINRMQPQSFQFYNTTGK